MVTVRKLSDAGPCDWCLAPASVELLWDRVSDHPDHSCAICALHWIGKALADG